MSASWNLPCICRMLARLEWAAANSGMIWGRRKTREKQTWTECLLLMVPQADPTNRWYQGPQTSSLPWSESHQHEYYTKPVWITYSHNSNSIVVVVCIIGTSLLPRLPCSGTRLRKEATVCIPLWYNSQDTESDPYSTLGLGFGIGEREYQCNIVTALRSIRLC